MRVSLTYLRPQKVTNYCQNQATLRNSTPKSKFNLPQLHHHHRRTSTQSSNMVCGVTASECSLSGLVFRGLTPRSLQPPKTGLQRRRRQSLSSEHALPARTHTLHCNKFTRDFYAVVASTFRTVLPSLRDDHVSRKSTRCIFLAASRRWMAEEEAGCFFFRVANVA